MPTNEIVAATATNVEISPMTVLTAAQVAADYAAGETSQAVLEAAPDGISVVDTATDIEASLPRLATEAIGSITATDGPVTVSAAQFEAYQSTLDKVEGGFVVSDTIANIETAHASLKADADHVASIVVIAAPTSAGETSADATNEYSTSQVAVVVNSDKSLTITSPDGSSSLAGVTAITLSNAVIAVSGDVLTTDYSDGSKSVSTSNITGETYTNSVVTVGADGFVHSKLYTGVKDDFTLSWFEYLYAGNNLIGEDEYYSGIVGQTYSGLEAEYDGGGNLVRDVYTGVSGASYSSYENDFVGGVYTGSKFLVTSAPAGAAYSSYELDYDSSNNYLGETFFFTGVTGQAYTNEDVSFDKKGALSGYVLTGFSNEPYDEIDQFYNAGTYAGEQVDYAGVTGASYTGMKVDTNASGALTYVEYDGITGEGDLSSIEQDYSGGAITQTTYGYADITGESYYAKSVVDDSAGKLVATIYDNNNGTTSTVGPVSGATLPVLGGETTGVPGSGSSAASLLSNGASTTGATLGANDAGLQLLGVNLAGADFGPHTTTSVYGTDYTYPTDQEIDYYASKGLNVIRVPFLWEHMQTTLDGPLVPAELARLTSVVDYAASKGIKTIIDVHDYGSYAGNLIGSAAVPDSDFANFWGQLAASFASQPDVMFGLMNEPNQQSASDWLVAANDAIAAIRGAGANQEILVPGSYWDGAWTWTTTDNASVVGTGVEDPDNNYAFEVHQYLDPNGSGTQAGVSSVTIGVDRLTDVTQWAESHNAKLFLGEFGVSSDSESLTAMNNMLTYMGQNSSVWQGATYWAGGPWWWGTNIYGIEPSGLGTSNVQDQPQMAILTQHLPTA
jgi:aryl-phospho-beta-D-glucosidase BglC (GH1 family)